MASIPIFNGQVGSTVAQTASPVQSLDSVINASRLGTNDGLVQPTTLGSIVQGTQGAIDTYENYQSQELNQEAQQIANERNKFNLEQDKKQQEVSGDQAVQTQQAQLELQARQAERQKQLILDQQELEATLQSNDPAVVSDALLSGRYAAVLSDPNYAKSVFRGAASRGLLTSQATEVFLNDSNNKIEQAARERDRVAASLRYEKNLEALNKDPLAGELSTLGYTQAKAIKNLQVISASGYDESGNKIDPGASTLSDETLNAMEYGKGKYRLKDTTTGKVLPGMYNKEGINILQQLQKDSYVDDTLRDTPAAGGIREAQGLQTTTTDINTKKPDKITPEASSALAQQTFEERRAAKAALYRSKMKKPAPTPVAPPNGPPAAYTPAPANVSVINPELKPSEYTSINSFVGQPVSLNLNNGIKVAKRTLADINTNPLLVGEPALIKGLVTTESAGNPEAVSSTGVRGLFQVTGNTMKYVQNKYKDQVGDRVLDPTNPEDSKLAGTLYLLEQLTRFKADSGGLQVALAAYNGGPGRMQDAVEAVGSYDWDSIVKHLQSEVINGNLTPAKFQEIKDYPGKVISAASQYLGHSPDTDTTFVQLLQANNLIAGKV